MTEISVKLFFHLSIPSATISLLYPDVTLQLLPNNNSRLWRYVFATLVLFYGELASYFSDFPSNDCCFSGRDSLEYAQSITEMDISDMEAYFPFTFSASKLINLLLTLIVLMLLVAGTLPSEITVFFKLQKLDLHVSSSNRSI